MTCIISVCTWSLHVVICHTGVAAVTLCRDVLSTSWNGEGSIRICSMSTGLSSSSSSQALICISQSQGREMDSELTEFLMIHLDSLISLLCSIGKVQYLLWGHGVSQWRDRSLLRKEEDRWMGSQFEKLYRWWWDDPWWCNVIAHCTTCQLLYVCIMSCSSHRIAEVGSSCHVGLMPLSELSLPTWQ